MFGQMLRSHGDRPAMASYRTASHSGSNLSTYTFAGVDIGPAELGRRVLVGAANEGDDAIVISGVTLNGVAMTQVAFKDSFTPGNSLSAGLWIADLDVGATATIAVSTFGASRSCGIGIWALYSLLSSIPTAIATSAAEPMVLDCNIEADGFVVGIGTSDSSPAVTWTGATERFELPADSTKDISGADGASLIPQVPHVLRASFASGLGQCGVAASFR